MSIRNAYNNWSEQYDSNDNKTRDLDRKVTVEILAQYSFGSVLELGCGTGKNTSWLITRAETILALDFSEGMLREARQKITSDKVEFRVCDLNKDWDVADDSVDLVTSSLTLEHIDNIDSIFSQAYAKLVSGGKFFISELHPLKQYMGSKAKYEGESGLVELDVFVHHLSDYLYGGRAAGFKLIDMREWFDKKPKDDLPTLISFVFEK